MHNQHKLRIYVKSDLMINCTVDLTFHANSVKLKKF